MTTLRDLLNDFAKDIIYNVVELKDPKGGDVDYDDLKLEMAIDDIVAEIKKQKIRIEQ